MTYRNRLSRITLARLTLTVILGQALAQFETTVTGNPDNLAFVDFPATLSAGETVKFVVKQPVIVQSTYASLELMAGTSGDGSNTVEDIMVHHLTRASDVSTSVLPKNLPAGNYHAAAFACTTPPNYRGIASVSDPEYRSLYISGPAAGDVLTVPIAPHRVLNPAGFPISWHYRDYRNSQGIDNLIMEFVTQTNASATGSIYDATFSSAGVFTTEGTSTSYPYSTAALSPGEWRIRAHYTNIYHGEGTLNLSYISQPFYIEGDKSKCYGLISTGDSSSNTSSSDKSATTGAAVRGELSMGLAIAVVLCWVAKTLS